MAATRLQLSSFGSRVGSSPVEAQLPGPHVANEVYVAHV
jgi:hypothetical protein